jgi:hypothetical protein
MYETVCVIIIRHKCVKVTGGHLNFSYSWETTSYNSCLLQFYYLEFKTIQMYKYNLYVGQLAHKNKNFKCSWLTFLYTFLLDNDPQGLKQVAILSKNK